MHVCLQDRHMVIDVGALHSHGATWKLEGYTCMSACKASMEVEIGYTSRFVCAILAGAMLIFSVSFQFWGPDCHPEIVSHGSAEPIWDMAWPSAFSMQAATCSSSSLVARRRSSLVAVRRSSIRVLQACCEDAASML